MNRKTPILRSFSLNSQEFYDAVCERVERPWIPNGSLPREPRKWELEALRAQDVWGTSEHEEGKVKKRKKGR